MQVALHITVWTALFMMVFGVIGGFLCRKIGSRLPLIIAAVSLLVGSALWIQWHSTWPEQLFIGILYGLCAGFYFAANPNLLMDAVPTSRQGVSAAMLAVFGAVGTAVATAAFTAIVSAHPFQIVAVQPGVNHPVVQNVPQVYTNTGYSLVYLLLGVVPMVLTLLIALALRTGRTPARGGAPEETAEPETPNPTETPPNLTSERGIRGRVAARACGAKYPGPALAAAG
jgi:MFS family permease